jgi:hypothetical protein
MVFAIGGRLRQQSVSQAIFPRFLHQSDARLNSYDLEHGFVWAIHVNAADFPSGIILIMEYLFVSRSPMEKISPAQLKKSILDVEAERLKHSPRFQPDRTQRTTLQTSAAAGLLLATGMLWLSWTLAQQLNAAPTAQQALYMKSDLKTLIGGLQAR